MATANTTASAPGSARSALRQRKRRWPLVVMVILALLIAVFVWFWGTINGYAQAGASYGARVACSCRYAGGRTLADCTKDFEPGMGMIALSEDAHAHSVTARFPLLARQTAIYREGWGCQLEPWKR